MTQTDQQNVPKLRFPGFEGAWKPEKLGTHVTIFSGASPSKFNLKASGKVPFIKVEDLNNCEKFQEKSRTYTSHQKGVAPTNSVIFPKRGAAIMNNKVRIAAVPVQMDSNLMAVATNKETLDAEFLYYEILRFELHRIADTSTIPQLNNKHINPFEIYFPTLPEQHKIAGFLGTMDTKIAQLASRQRLLEDYKKGCMQQLFSQKIRFKDDTGNDYPDWEEKRLGEIGETFGGLTGKSADDFGTGARFVTYLQVFKASQIHPEQCGFVEIGPTERQNKVQLGDIIFTTSSETPLEVGFASVVTTNLTDTYLNSFCFGLRPKSTDELLPAFSRYLFRSADYRTKVIPLAQGSTRYNLSKTSFLKIKLHIPHPNEQRKIADFLSGLDRKIDLVRQELDHARSFKQGLLQQMFV